MLMVEKEQPQMERSPQDAPSPIQRAEISSESDIQRNWSDAPKSLILMTAYLYFMQGLIIAVGMTMPFIYPILPGYSILSIFALSTLPWSFKFVIAPFIEKYNFPIYGKRKTWIIASQLITAALLFLSSFFTQQQNAYWFALIIISVNLFMSIQNIALDALAIKELRSASLVSAITTTFQGFGFIFGALIFLKLTSVEFAQNFLNHNQALMAPQSVLLIIVALVGGPAILVQILYRETVLESDLEIAEKSFCETLWYYKIFFDRRSKHCRMMILFLVIFQGWNFFEAGYHFELVNAGISRNTLNSIENIIAIPTSLLLFPAARIFPLIGIRRSLLIFGIFYQALLVSIYIFFPINIYWVGVNTFFFTFLNSSLFIMIAIMMNSYPRTGVMGMFISFLSSASNLGSQKAFHTKITGIFGWTTVAAFGLILQVFILMAFIPYSKWMEAGDVGVNGLIRDSDHNVLQQEMSEQPAVEKK